MDYIHLSTRNSIVNGIEAPFKMLAESNITNGFFRRRVLEEVRRNGQTPMGALM
jgi:hypothetical protein